MKRVPFQPLEPGTCREIVRRALAEDVSRGDVTTAAIVDRRQQAHAVLLAKAPCVLAGLDVAFEAFRQLDPGVAITVHRHDGPRPSAQLVDEAEGELAPFRLRLAPEAYARARRVHRLADPRTVAVSRSPRARFPSTVPPARRLDLDGHDLGAAAERLARRFDHEVDLAAAAVRQ